MINILDVLDVVWQEWRKVGQLFQAGQAEPFEEVRGGPVQDRAGLRVRPGFLDQAAQHERAHHPVAVDAAHGRHAGPVYRLPVGNDREGLERRLGEPYFMAVRSEEHTSELQSRSDL